MVGVVADRMISVSTFDDAIIRRHRAAVTMSVSHGPWRGRDVVGVVRMMDRSGRRFNIRSTRFAHNQRLRGEDRGWISRT